MLDLVKSEHLSKHLPRVAKDARDAFQILAKNPSGVMKPIDTCYGLVLKQSVRVMCTDEIADTPKLMDTYFYYTWILQHIASGHTSATPWLPSLSHMKRRWCRSGLQRLLTPLVNRRMEKGAPRVDDTLQNLIDNGDSKDFIITCLISLVFISVANAGKLLGVMLKTMAQHTDWQEKAYSEIKAVVKVHAMNKDAPLVEQLSSIPLEAWESDFPMIDRCFKEAIRLHVSFPMLRQNMSSDSIRIPGSNEVIPAGSFVGYYTSDAHQNEDLYPNPTKLDPDRWLEGSDISKKQSYSCKYFKVISFQCQATEQNKFLVKNITAIRSDGLLHVFLKLCLDERAMTDSLESSQLGQRPSPLRWAALGQTAGYHYHCPRPGNVRVALL